MELTTRVVHAAWRAPLSAAHGGTTGTRPLVLVTLEAPDGMVGYGEAAPLESYDGTSLEMVLETLDAYAPLLAAAGTIDPAGHPAVLDACRQRIDLPQALAAVDLALWDLAGKRAEKPVWWLLGASEAPELAVNAVIGAEAASVAADQAATAVRAGFSTVKVKVGVGDDVARVRAVRSAVGPGVAVRVDANGAWPSVPTAVAALERLAPFRIELCEEPLHGAAALSEVSAATSVPIAVDESVHDAEVFQRRVADLVCLKIAACGGISGLIFNAATARTLGYEPFLASTLDGPLGIAAALHCAAAISPARACGLATLDRFSPPAPLTAGDGQMAPPPGPGLGDGLLDWYAALEG